VRRAARTEGALDITRAVWRKIVVALTSAFGAHGGWAADSVVVTKSYKGKKMQWQWQWRNGRSGGGWKCECEEGETLRLPGSYGPRILGEGGN
jgi:hypothetical protein